MAREPSPSITMTTPEEIEAFARNPENHEAFAALLTKVLPAYTKFIWGSPVVYKRHFLEWQQAGFSLYPNHYYSPIPDLTRLTDEQLGRRTSMPGIKFDSAAMLRLADAFHQKYAAEYAVFGATPPNHEGKFFFSNGVYERVDAEILHCMIRHFGPRRFIEIGSGYSSLVTAAACERNRAEGRAADLTLIEPYPNDIFLQTIPGVSRLLRTGVEECPLRMFEELEAGDILFIDSSHVIRSGNDVEFEYFEILPRLRPGVIVHIHDIFLPFRYPANWIKHEHVFWNEQYLVEALLTHNPSYQVLWAGCYLHTEHPGHLMKAFPGYDPKRNQPGSIWIVRR